MSTDYVPTSPNYAAIRDRATIIVRARLGSITPLTLPQIMSPEHNYDRVFFFSQILSMARNELFVVGTDGITPADFDNLYRDLCIAVGT